MIMEILLKYFSFIRHNNKKYSLKDLYRFPKIRFGSFPLVALNVVDMNKLWNIYFNEIQERWRNLEVFCVTSKTLIWFQENFFFRFSFRSRIVTESRCVLVFCSRSEEQMNVSLFSLFRCTLPELFVIIKCCKYSSCTVYCSLLVFCSTDFLDNSSLDFTSGAAGSDRSLRGTELLYLYFCHLCISVWLFHLKWTFQVIFMNSIW